MEEHYENMCMCQGREEYMLKHREGSSLTIIALEAGMGSRHIRGRMSLRRGAIDPDSLPLSLWRT